MYYSQLSRVSIDAVRTMCISHPFTYNYTRKSIQCSPDENPRALATSQFNTFQKHKRHEHTRTNTRTRNAQNKLTTHALCRLCLYRARAPGRRGGVLRYHEIRKCPKLLLLIDASSSSLRRRILVRCGWIQHVRRCRRRSTRPPSSVPMGTQALTR